jgi:hypothetical protein
MSVALKLHNLTVLRFDCGSTDGVLDAIYHVFVLKINKITDKF